MDVLFDATRQIEKLLDRISTLIYRFEQALGTAAEATVQKGTDLFFYFLRVPCLCGRFFLGFFLNAEPVDVLWIKLSFSDTDKELCTRVNSSDQAPD